MYKSLLMSVIALTITGLTSCGGNGESGSKIDSENQNQQVSLPNEESVEPVMEESDSETLTREDSLRMENERLAKLEAEKGAKEWKGVTSMSEFKSKLPGTVWGATRQRGDFYFTFEINGNTIVTRTYTKSDFSPSSEVGSPMVETIDSWKDLGSQDAFTVTAYQDGADKDDWATVPTMLAFRKGKPDAQWATTSGTIPLKQILK